MPSFSSVSELEEFLNKACKQAVKKTEDDIKSAIKEQVDVYYNEYTPYAYIRTNQLEHALRKKLDRNGLGFEVFFDNEKMNYKKGPKLLQHTYDKDSPIYHMMGFAKWETDDILETAVGKGLHGGYIKGTPIWQTSMEQIGRVPDLLKKNMISSGIPVE